MLPGSFVSDESMFDNDGTMYHSKDCAPSDTECSLRSTDSAHGIEVTFFNPIRFEDLIIQTRKYFRRYRYQSVCLYANENKIACTPNSNYYVPNNFIYFADFLDGNPQSNIIASKFKLKWEGTEKEARIAQIIELYIDYTDGMLYF